MVRQTVHVAPYLIGVFDTVAALGAKGARRLGIKAVLIAGTAFLGAAFAAILATVIAGIKYGISGSWSWPVAFILVGLGAFVAGVWQWWKQRRSIFKSISDFPNNGDFRWHFAEWKGEYFDRLLSRFVTYARSANAIDETRVDFTRVAWDVSSMPEWINGHKHFRQWWFAGNHSDIGGSYAEAELRLSDIALVWMIEEATGIPNGLKVGPVFVNGGKIPNTGDRGNRSTFSPPPMVCSTVRLPA